MNTDELKNIVIEPQEGSTVKISGEIPFSYLEKERATAVKNLGKNIKADGFREGHIPEKVIVERVGEMAVLGEMAERALSKVYPEIVKTNELEVIGYPQISLTKLAQDNPLGFTAIVAIMPEISLPDYKKIAKEKNGKKETSEVTQAEVDAQIKDIFRQKAAYERLQEKAKDTEAKTDEPETHTHADGTVHEGPAHDDEVEVIVPKLTDELVKTLGQPGQFESVEDFKAKIREHLEMQKKQDVDSKHRAEITDAIIDETKVILPQVMIDAEINQMFAQMEGDLERAKLKMDDYLGHIKKTREDLKKEWTPAAEKRAKLQLVLNGIAEKENPEIDKGELDRQVLGLLEQYKDADEARVRTYIESVLQNEAVMRMLENE